MLHDVELGHLFVMANRVGNKVGSRVLQDVYFKQAKVQNTWMALALAGTAMAEVPSLL